MALVQTTHICQSFYMLLQMWVVCLDAGKNSQKFFSCTENCIKQFSCAPKLKAVILRPHSKEWGFNFGHNKLRDVCGEQEMFYKHA